MFVLKKTYDESLQKKEEEVRILKLRIATLEEAMREPKKDRESIGSISLEQAHAHDKMGGRDEYDHLSEAHAIFKNKAFKEDHDHLIDVQVHWMAEQDESLGRPEFGIFARGTINGIRLFYELMQQHAQAFEEKLKPDEPFDKFHPLPEYQSVSR